MLSRHDEDMSNHTWILAKEGDPFWGVEQHTMLEAFYAVTKGAHEAAGANPREIPGHVEWQAGVLDRLIHVTHSAPPVFRRIGSVSKPVPPLDTRELPSKTCQTAAWTSRLFRNEPGVCVQDTNSGMLNVTGAPGPAPRSPLGFVGDVGDLAKLIQGKNGVRDVDDLDERLSHELSDCLWSVIILADRFGIDLPAAFLKTMDELERRLTHDAQAFD